MDKDYSKMTVKELEEEISKILKEQRNQNDLFRLAVFVGQMDLAKHIYYDKKYVPEGRHKFSKSSEIAAYGQALVQLLLLMNSRGMDFTNVFGYAVEHMKDSEYKERIPDNENEVKGHPVSGGKVSGKAHVVFDKNMDNIPTDSILVMEHADSDIVKQISNFRAVVTDQGGRLCHLAVVAREMNIPSVVGTGNATKIIKTGDEITVDADAGVVRIN